MKQVIVVEGIHDLNKIKEVYKDAYIEVTGGKIISQDLIKRLKEYSKTSEIILFFDPDFPGESIRKAILKEIPNCLNAYIKKEKAISKNKKKVGVEHASKEDIIESLKNLYKNEEKEGIYNFSLMYELGLTGYKDSSLKRAYLADILNIGRPNTKMLIERLNAYNIALEKIKEILKEYENSC